MSSKVLHETQRSKNGVAKKVRSFYEEYSFPGYEAVDTLSALVEKASKGVYAELLDEQIPYNARILDVGCGTGQLPIYLSITNRKAFGVDFCYSSLRKGNDFKRKYNLRNVSFAQMDIFNMALKQEAFDYVFCNGVLHHTGDAYGGFKILCGLVKRGGYIIIGLYNKYGRLLLNLRRFIFNVTQDRLLKLDYYMRRKDLDDHKKKIWFMDQYKNPHETEHTIDEVLSWFDENGIAYINSVPKINLTDDFTEREKLFEKHDVGGKLDHILSQLGWIFTKGREGGFFIMIGRKSNSIFL